ncbi:SseB family protein [Streptococcus sp. CSL10205-OR2]|uniref:SseB family protein n=1 Tax=Streptococcus sp. CSL10205-OR2 TaxID=2980558 RepID=UPI0021D99047|nr:SseB family protein [Streptococcus sp. CSL10205-OR2]MCU9534054.1 SseB family protein [Streptococcus sp. CSL10205-OR2]
MTNKTNNNIMADIDKRLRAFINTPDNFLDSIAFVNSLHQSPVWASEAPYAIEVDGKKVTPVFTDEKDLDAFKAVQESAQNQHWTLRSSLEILEEALVNKLYGLVFNLKKTGDFGNTTTFKSQELVTFINYFTAILNRLMNEDNQKAEKLEKYYLIPSFSLTKEKNEKRLFPTMTNPDGDIYIPVFSNLESFARWYNHEKFGLRFREAKGNVLAWQLTELKQPQSGENEILPSKGIVINPFDEEMEMLSWDQLP